MIFYWLKYEYCLYTWPWSVGIHNVGRVYSYVFLNFIKLNIVVQLITNHIIFVHFYSCMQNLVPGHYVIYRSNYKLEVPLRKGEVDAL